MYHDKGQHSNWITLLSISKSINLYPETASPSFIEREFIECTFFDEIVVVEVEGKVLS